MKCAEILKSNGSSRIETHLNICYIIANYWIRLISTLLVPTCLKGLL